MIRILSVAVFAGLVALLFLSPGVSPARLATKQVATLLTEEANIVGPDGEIVRDEKGEPERRPLWQAILDSSAVTVEIEEDGTERRVLRPGGSQFIARREVLQEGEAPDPMWHMEAIQSFVRRMRSIVAEEDLDVRIDAFKKTDREGFNIGTTVDADTLSITANIGGEEFARRSVPWRPITQLSLLPPLIAIFFAILLRRPVVALFAGVWSGAYLVRGTVDSGVATDLGQSFVDVFRVYLLEQLSQWMRFEIVMFVVFMLAMVGVITKAGGIRGIMDRISVLARDAKRTQIATWLMGLTVFFDDYANTILVGSTMRPLADKFRVSREKLAYIVDSTAAPVAGVSLLSTWIAFEVSTFSAQLPDAGLAPADGYAVFLQTLPYRFYCWFTLFFVGLIVITGRDFGPMLTAERRARAGQLLRPGATPMVGKAATELEASPSVVPRAATALVPLALFVLTTLGTILFKGALGVGLLVREADSFLPALGKAPGGFLETATGILFAGSGNFPLMLGAIVGFLAAMAFALLRGLAMGSALTAAINSIRATGIAIVILYLAWMVGAVCEDLGTASYLSAMLSSNTPYIVVPVALFLLAGLIAFSTGSSWGTMTILLPLVIGLTYDLGTRSAAFTSDEAARAAGLFLMVVSIGAVLEGAIFGDHCSPISDTTVMSSIACASDHVDHVRTQAPYALVTMFVALAFGYVPVVVLELSPWIALVAGCLALTLFVLLRGRRAEHGDAAAPVRESGAT